MLIDVHAHYDDKRYDSDRDEVLREVKESGIDVVINSGSSIKTSMMSSDLAEKYDFIYASAGVHPHEAEHTPDNTLDILEDLLKNKKIVAIGEIGLDFYYNFSDKESQRRWFKKQMDFAAELKYPVVIHDREAHAETLEMAKRYKNKVRGIFHCYTGDVETAKELVKLGYMMSFGGMCTFSSAKICHDVLKEIPAEYIMLETDCPYLAPHPHRGKRNDSRYLPLIAEKIAEIKKMAVDELILKTGINAQTCFNLN